MQELANRLADNLAGSDICCSCLSVFGVSCLRIAEGGPHIQQIPWGRIESAIGYFVLTMTIESEPEDVDLAEHYK